MKFRFSYGISGNQGISPYQTLSRYGTDKYYNDGDWATTIGPGYVSGWTGPGWIYRVWSGIPNPDLKWETTAQADFGIDMAFFNRRLQVSLTIMTSRPVICCVNAIWPFLPVMIRCG